MTLRLFAIAVAAFALAGCGVTRNSVSIAPVGVVRVPESAMPPHSNKFGGDGLRIDFTSSPDLLTEEGYAFEEVQFCGDDRINPTLNIGGPFLGRDPAHHQVDRQRAAAKLTASPPLIYSVYLFVARPALEPAFPLANRPEVFLRPGEPAYDLRREPRAICLWLRLREGYEFERHTNTLTFSAEQVRAALQAR